MELQAVSGQLYVSNGVVQPAEDAPGLLAQSAPKGAARGRERDLLFIHLTVGGQPEEVSTVSQDLLDTISHRYFSTPGSVTASLRRAILECNSLLLNHNLSSSGPPRLGAIFCAVLRGEEIYIAQAGEAYGLLGRNFGVERLPPDATSSDSPLGRSAGLNIRLFHNWLQVGDVLLLADPRLSHLSTEFHAILMDLGLDDAMPAIQGLIGTGSGRVIMVEFTDEPPFYVPDSKAQFRSIPEPTRLGPPGSAPQRDDPIPRVPVRSEQQNNRTSIAVPDVETVETAARQATSRVALGMSHLTGWIADLMAKIRPPHERQPDDASWPLLTLLTVAIPVLVAIVVTGVYVQRGRVVQLGQIKRDVRENITLAQSADEDIEGASYYYSEAQRLANEGLTLRPGDEVLAQLRLEAQTELDKLSGIARLSGSVLHDYGSEARLNSIVLGEDESGGIFVVDAGRGLVLRHATTENQLQITDTSPETIMFGQQAIGSHVVGPVVDAIWRPQGLAVSRDGLAVLDASGSLITFYPNFADLRAVPLDLASLWRQPGAITTYNERLYILDTQANAIWRYLANDDGFSMNADSQKVEFDGGLDLTLATDFAIHEEDGSVILGFSDGRLGRYVSGRLLWSEADLATNGLTDPIVTPSIVKIAGRGLNSSIFVADPPTGRIIQISIAGIFLAEFKANDEFGNELFSSIRDFAVADNPLRFYVITESKLYSTSQR